MRWEDKPYLGPKAGDKKVVTKFAWIPIRAIDAVTQKEINVWLENYEEILVYGASSGHWGWYPISYDSKRVY